MNIYMRPLKAVKLGARHFFIGHILFFLSVPFLEASGPEGMPVREISLIATDKGFYPQRIVVFNNEVVRFHFATTSKTPRCFTFKKAPLFLSVAPGELESADLDMSQVAKYVEKEFDENQNTLKFYCPKGGFEGELVVLTKRKNYEPKHKVFATNRQISEWVPKDE